MRQAMKLAEQGIGHNRPNPMVVAVEVLSLDLIAAWSIGVFYIIALGAAYGIRFKEGKWKSIRVIEGE